MLVAVCAKREAFFITIMNETRGYSIHARAVDLHFLHIGGWPVVLHAVESATQTHAIWQKLKINNVENALGAAC